MYSKTGIHQYFVILLVGTCASEQAQASRKKQKSQKLNKTGPLFLKATGTTKLINFDGLKKCQKGGLGH